MLIHPRGTRPILILGASVSNPDPRINVGFREGTVIAAGEGMDDAVRLVYSGGEPVLAGGERAAGKGWSFVFVFFFVFAAAAAAAAKACCRS